MDRPYSNKDLVERILKSPTRVVLLRGAVRCGKTDAALDFYGRFTTDQNQPRCLLMVPNRTTASHLVSKLLEQSETGVLVCPRVSTFSALAERILAMTGSTGRGLTSLERHLMLRRIVDELTRDGKLRALGPIADTRGLIAALDRAISELKRATVDPDAPQKVLSKQDQKHRDLIEGYREYQRDLHESNTYDVEGRMWEMRDALLKTDQEQCVGADKLEIDAIAVDGFTDFTPTQLQILKLLSESVERMLITLCYAEERRPRLWSWTQRTLDHIRHAFGDALSEIPTKSLRGASGVSVLVDKVFDFDASSCEVPLPLNVIAANGVEAEVSAVARRIKRLLVDGAPGGSIAVLARSMNGYRTTIERIFSECDVPIALSATPLTDIPIVRFAMDVPSLAPNFAFRDVLRTIKNSYFRPQSLGPYDQTTVAAAETLIREGNVLESRKTYRIAARWLVDSASRISKEEDDEEITVGRRCATPESLAGAAEMIEKLFDLSESQDLQRIIESLELREAACSHTDPDLIGRDLRALDTLQSAIGTLPSPPPQIATLREGLSRTFCPPPQTESMVTVLDVLDARAIRCDHLFLLGLNEGGFPQRYTDGAFLTESDRIAWSKRGIELPHRSDLTAREMFLFYMGISRPDQSLTLSYLESDSSGKPLAPSAFLLSLLEPCGGLKQFEGGDRFTRISHGQFLPKPTEVAAPPDTFLGGVVSLFGDAPDDWKPALSWSLRKDREKVIRAGKGIWAWNHRWKRSPCDRFDGRITDAGLCRGLEQRYPHQTVFSATQLSTYGQCPWWFFARYILKLEPLVVPERSLEPISRGVFVHNVLFRVMSALKETHEVLRLCDVEESDLLEALDRGVAAEAASIESRHLSYRGLWEIQKQQMHAEMRDYLLDQWKGSASGSQSLHFELSFGMSERGDELTDPKSRPDPVALTTEAGEVRVRGKIDRVDRAQLEDTKGLMVIDYKTGQLPRSKDIEEGRNLQLGIYIEAAEQILKQHSLQGAFHRVGGTKREELVRDSEELRETALTNITRFVNGMRSGKFEVLPTDKCPSYCPFRQICHYSPARVKFKSSPPQEGQE